MSEGGLRQEENRRYHQEEETELDPRVLESLRREISGELERRHQESNRGRAAWEDDEDYRRRPYSKKGYGDDERLDPRTMAAIRRELQEELRMLENRERRLAATDPQARGYAQEILDDLLEQGERYGLAAADLARLVPGLGKAPGLTRRIQAALKSPQGKAFSWGVGATLAAVALWPALSRTARPAAKAMVRGALDLADKAQATAAHVKEDMEDLVAQARYEKVQESMEPQLPGPEQPQ